MSYKSQDINASSERREATRANVDGVGDPGENHKAKLMHHVQLHFFKVENISELLPLFSTLKFPPKQQPENNK